MRHAKPTFGARLAKLRGDISQAEFAGKHGAHKNTYANYEREDREPAWGFLQNLVKAGVNVNWVLTGDGPMLLKDQVQVAPLDQGVLLDVLAVVEEELKRRNRYLEPEKKAELIMLLYEQICEEEGKVDRAKIVRLVKLAS